MKIAIIGANGQLGTDLVEVLSKEHHVIPLTHGDIEVEDFESCRTLLDVEPAIIINTAAFHRVDLCESNPDKTFAVNSIGAKNLAVIASELSAINIYISTDYVFDGEKKDPYTELDQANPLMTYGISKLAGESYTKIYSDKHYIFRIASVFGKAGASGKGGNFIETMISKARAGEALKVVNDMLMTPTYTKSAAKIIASVVEKELPYGIYHITNQPQCSWFDFTKGIFKLLDLRVAVEPVSMHAFESPVKKPKNSALVSAKLPDFGIQLENWENSLMDYLGEKKYL
ncbi:MAG: dTDP-4-dehydrorhamnose reductase [Actinobacteria bacterium]|nr:dTDP-4-dehydrorhamnose reductase [Actinomycetota bacterium]